MKKTILGLLFTFNFYLSPSLSFGQNGGGSFDSLSTGMTSPGAYVLSLAMKDSTDATMYAGGHFKIAGRDTAINIAEWIDTGSSGQIYNGHWLALGTGVDSDVCAVQMFGKYLYAGGKFGTAGGIACNHIARWDTSAQKWDSLIGTINGNVYALCVYNSVLYVGGDFTMINGITVNRIAMWNGTAWSAVGAGFNTGAVYALTVFNDSLVAGGSFLKSNAATVNHIAKWDGVNWNSLGSGTNNTVYAIAVDNNFGDLYVGGAFTKSGGINTKYISSYNAFNTYTWDSVGAGMNDTVRALNFGNGVNPVINRRNTKQGIGGGNCLVAGGAFTLAGGISCTHVAAWPGYTAIYNWFNIGDLNGPVFALSNPYDHFNGGNYVGGEFSIGGSTFGPSTTINNVAYSYIMMPGSGIPSLSNKSRILVYPNPSNGKFNLVFSHPELTSGSPTIEVYNVLGEKVYSQFTTHNSPFTIDLSSNPNGIYLYRVLAADGELIGQGKLIIAK